MSEPATAFGIVKHWAETTPDRLFLTQPYNGEVKTWTFAEAFESAGRLAQGLRDAGFAPGDAIALLSKNCAEWMITDLALSMAGIVSVPIYPTASSETIGYVLKHSGVRGLIIGRLDNPDVVRKAGVDGLTTIAMRYHAEPCELQWQALVEGSAPLAETHRPSGEEPMTILYTSGSTGRPKGVVLSYGAYAYACQTCADCYQGTPEDRYLSYLPLAHVAERTASAGPMLFAGAQFFFVDTLDTFVEDLKRARVTLFTSVPRLWVQFQAGVHRKIPPAKLQRLLSIPIIRGVVARRIRRELGLDHARLYGSGSAPISPLTLRWFERLGIRISEGWGMTETCGLSCTNLPFRSARIGSIGEPLPGTEMRVSEEGEILVRSPGLMTAYHRMPEETAATFTDDGFLRTGDKGEWDASVSGYRITGRVKDQFKSAKGKYVSPVPIEARLAGNPMVEQVCVMGTGLRAPVGVVVLAVSDLSADKQHVCDSLGETLNATNAMLEGHERLSGIAVCPDPWTIENDCLTPTLKIRRDVLESRYLEELSASGSESVYWLRAG